MERGIQILSEKSAKILLFGMKHIFSKNLLSPNIAADKEGKKILISKFNSKITTNLNKKLIIEGAGGLNVPINDKKLVVDLVSFFKLPIILVCRTSLGTINHTLLSINLLKYKNKTSWINLRWERIKETIDTIKKFGTKIYGKRNKNFS